MNWKDEHNAGKFVELTADGYPTEGDACKAFDAAIARTKLFRAYREVAGRYIQQSPVRDPKPGGRIDRILFPAKPLLDAGWPFGAVGVEIKKSGVKAGPVISQMIDYMHTAFELPGCSVIVMISYCFLFPCEKAGNAIASVMGQQRVGSGCLQYPETSEYHRLALFTGEHKIFSYYFNRPENPIEIGKNNIGRRSGSR